MSRGIYFWQRSDFFALCPTREAASYTQRRHPDPRHFGVYNIPEVKSNLVFLFSHDSQGLLVTKARLHYHWKQNIFCSFCAIRIVRRINYCSYCLYCPLSNSVLPGWERTVTKRIQSQLYIYQHQQNMSPSLFKKSYIHILCPEIKYVIFATQADGSPMVLMLERHESADTICSHFWSRLRSYALVAMFAIVWISSESSVVMPSQSGMILCTTSNIVYR